MTKSAFLIALALGGNLTQGERIAAHEATVETSSAAWGRSCESLESRFTHRSANLAEMEGAKAFVGSVSMLRTLRRANARNCSWVTSAEVDVSGIAGLARNYLKQAPCYNQATAAMEAAQNLPEEECESAMEDALVMLLSPNCSTEVSEAPELDSSDETMEEEMDDATDVIMDRLASSQTLSLIQQEQNPFSIAVSGWEYMFLASGSWGFIVAAILVGILMGTLCGVLIHTIVRIFRWIKCSITGGSSCDYYPDTWVRFFVQSGCRVAGLMFGPYGLIGGINAAFGANLAVTVR